MPKSHRPQGPAQGPLWCSQAVPGEAANVVQHAMLRKGMYEKGQVAMPRRQSGTLPARSVPRAWQRSAEESQRDRHALPYYTRK